MSLLAKPGAWRALFAKQLGVGLFVTNSRRVRVTLDYRTRGLPCRVSAYQKSLEGKDFGEEVGVEHAADHLALEAVLDGVTLQQSHGEATTHLAPELTRQLERFGKAGKITQNTIVQGAWALLLSRYSGEKDVLFGATVSGRSAPVTGIESMMGLFINTLPVRVAVENDELTSEFLRRLFSPAIAPRNQEPFDSPYPPERL